MLSFSRRFAANAADPQPASDPPEQAPAPQGSVEPPSRFLGDSLGRGLPIASLSAASAQIPDRYELKYLIPEWQTDRVRRAIEPFCILDPHAGERGEYTIYSLYLDTPAHDLYRISTERRARRWKARVRGYEGSDTVFLEVKSKDHDLVRKHRARIPAADFAGRIDRHASSQEHGSPAERLFCDRVERYHLVPTLMVRYRREAWLSTVDAYARVTFDRCVACQPWDTWSLAADERNWVAIDGAACMRGVPQGVVLELKCLCAVPRWLSGLTRALGLSKTRYSKFCKGMARVYGPGGLLDLLDQG